MKKNVNLRPIFIREQVIKAIRDFFYNKNFHEVITPTLNTALPVEPNIYAFTTRWQTQGETKELYLATSPESGLKKMLARGIGNCFAISKSFRTLEGAGSLHNPEFLMLEWYRENARYPIIMKDLQELILDLKKRIDEYLDRKGGTILTYQGKEIDLAEPWETFSLVELFKKYAQLNLENIIDDTSMMKAAQAKGYTIDKATWGQLFDQMLVNEIEPQLPKSPFFLTDFPARISPLCEVNKNKPYLAERFECYIAGYEIGNGNNENTDYESIKTIFEAEKKKRNNSAEVDEEFIEALKRMQGKQYAGIGIGIDRLAMIFTDVTDISEVELFTIK